jgi:hypothetical protein
MNAIGPTGICCGSNALLAIYQTGLDVRHPELGDRAITIRWSVTSFASTIGPFPVLQVH